MYRIAAAEIPGIAAAEIPGICVSMDRSPDTGKAAKLYDLGVLLFCEIVCAQQSCRLCPDQL